MKTILRVLILGLCWPFTASAIVYYLTSSPGAYPADPYQGTKPIVVLDAANEIYLVEDAAGSGGAWQAIQTYTNQSPEVVQTSVTASGPKPKIDTTKLYVNSVTLAGTTLRFDIRNLVVGDNYLIAGKKMLDATFTNFWQPQWSFTAASQNAVLAVPMPTDFDGFYRIIDYSQYQGPSPVITSPEDNSVVTETVQVNCGLTDIFRADQATLFVDGINFGTVTNGAANWSLDTTLLANGTHSIDVQFLSEIPITDEVGSNNIELWTSDAILYNLTTSNFFAQNVAPRCFTAEFGTVPFAFDTAAPAVVSVSVYDATTNLLDNSGNPVPLPESDQSITYQVEVSAKPYSTSSVLPKYGGGGSTANFSLNISTDPHAGRTAVFRNQYIPIIDTVEHVDDNLDAALDQTIGAVLVAWNIHPNDMDGWDRGMNPLASPYVFVSDDNLPFFYNVLTNQGTGQFMYICDATGTDFGAGRWTTITDTFDGSTIAQCLGNSIKPSYRVYGHRVRLADIEGCNSASGDLNFAFGSPDGLDNLPMSKSSFVGWTSKVWYNGVYRPDTTYVEVIKYWQSYWVDMGFDDNIGVSHANYQCLQAVGASVDDQLARKIRGSKGMTWIKKD
jgi:hypothetical protein